MSISTPVSRIVTHPGSAHKDDLLACALLVASQGAAIERREPAPEDLEDSSTAVVDVGGRYEPEKNNFDHHQFPKDDPPTCSLSLVLRAMDRYDAAKQFCSWLEPAEWFDCRGPNATAKHLGVPREAIHQLNSPIDVTLLRRFASLERIDPGDTIYEVLRMIGQDLIEYIDGLLEKIEYIDEHSELWSLLIEGEKKSVLFLPRLDPLPPEPSAGLDLYVSRKGLEEKVVGLVYPDRRNTGYGLSRYNDKECLDFTRLQDEADVHFAHARGFVAKTIATDIDRLRELIDQARVKDD